MSALNRNLIPLVFFMFMAISTQAAFAQNAKLVDAVTRDANGNGYLDGIEATFDRPVSINPSSLSTIKIAGNDVVFPCDSIIAINDSTVWMYLLENHPPQPIETGLQQFLSIKALTGILDIINFPCRDGAGPVIVNVINRITPQKHYCDSIQIELSEKLMKKSDSLLYVYPHDYFNFWLKTSDGYCKQDSVLSGIFFPMKIIADSVIQFIIRKENTLTRSIYASLASPGIIRDRSGNPPSPTNCKIPVRLHGDVTPTLTVFSNPSVPTIEHIMPGIFHASHEPDALRWVYDDNAGFVFIIPFIPPEDDYQMHAQTTIKQGGRILQKDYASNIEKNLPSSSKSNFLTYTIYWNGYDKKGRPADPGLYTVEVDLEFPAYSNIFHLEEKLVIIHPRETESDFGRCGQGISLALIPPLLYRFRKKVAGKR